MFQLVNITVNFSITMSNDDFCIVHNNTTRNIWWCTECSSYRYCEMDDHNYNLLKLLLVEVGNQNAASSSGSSLDSQAVMAAVIGDH